MRRPGSILAALFAAGVLASVGFVVPGATAARTGPVPKVVLIVGPAGSATNGYRAEARAAAAVARKYTPDVTEVYSPNATWPAVKAALQDASLVVYMGHGNGWPSPYRDTLYPPTQDGFGLNPSAGSGDDAHQYYGEGRIASSRPSREGRGRAAAPPLLRQRPVRAGAPGRDAGRGRAAHRQLRQRLRRRGRVGRHRRGVCEPVRLREGDPRRRPVDRLDLAHRPERQRPGVRLREHPKPGLPRADGPRDRDVGLRALDRPEGRARARRRPRRRPRHRQRAVRRSTPARPACSARA